MGKAFDTIAAGLREAIAIENGQADPSSYAVHVPSEVDVRAIRRRRNMTQAQFAAAYGFTLGRLRDWEQARSKPKGPERVLLTVIAREPEAVARALTGG